MTRVAPVFDALIAADSTGAGWLPWMLKLGNRADSVGDLAKHARLVENHGKRWGDSEVPLHAPLALLEYLVQHISVEQVNASDDRDEVRQNRLKLAGGDTKTIAEALAFLRSGARGRQWFVLEGESKPDALLEMTDAVLVVEGKRTERSCTSTTKWMGVRSQLLRHMDAAMDRYRGKPVFGLLLVEGEGGGEATDPSPHWLTESAAQYEPGIVDASLPHRSVQERKMLSSRILGVATWQAVCAAQAIPWPPFADAT